MKRGHQTTEFYITLLVIALAFALTPDQQAWIAAVTAAVAQAAYSISRGIAKQGGSEQKAEIKLLKEIIPAESENGTTS